MDSHVCTMPQRKEGIFIAKSYEKYCLPEKLKHLGEQTDKNKYKFLNAIIKFNNVRIKR